MTNADHGEFDKTVLIEALRAEWRSLEELCAGLDAGEWDLPTECPGWSVKDNVSHIIGTELGMAGHSMPDVEIGSVDHVRNPIGEANEHWIEERRSRSGAEVLSEFSEVTAARLTDLEAMPQADFDAPSWTPAGDATFGRMIRIRLFDSWMHDQDIRQATGRPGNEAGDHVELVLQEMIASMGYVVGKLGGAPPESRVQIDLAGPFSTTVRVAVEGRARVVDEFDDEPTIGIAMPLLLFTRLCGGRMSPATALAEGAVELSGDTEAGRRIVENLAYMI